MAFIKSEELNSGITVPAAYVRIDTVAGNKSQLFITLKSYLDKDSFQDNKAAMMQKEYSFVPSVEEGSENFIKQGYEYLKTLPEFTGSIDV